MFGVLVIPGIRGHVSNCEKENTIHKKIYYHIQYNLYYETFIFNSCVSPDWNGSVYKSLSFWNWMHVHEPQVRISKKWYTVDQALTNCLCVSSLFNLSINRMCNEEGQFYGLHKVLCNMYSRCELALSLLQLIPWPKTWIPHCWNLHKMPLQLISEKRYLQKVGHIWDLSIYDRL